ncbi:hypothetical protein chiPu_0006888 [Chiloscyllium punctatum]|uniref:Uncharacterized protein n=1 Tax=Chiloscyllium punctatum TaxID=137246 RepID=A0A401SDI9_CHIPU|nr:hypothetical protein [Chiloscyllium punctatum]
MGDIASTSIVGQETGYLIDQKLPKLHIPLCRTTELLLVTCQTGTDNIEGYSNYKYISKPRNNMNLHWLARNLQREK